MFLANQSCSSPARVAVWLEGLDSKEYVGQMVRSTGGEREFLRKGAAQMLAFGLRGPRSYFCPAPSYNNIWTKQWPLFQQMWHPETKHDPNSYRCTGLSTY